MSDAARCGPMAAMRSMKLNIEIGPDGVSTGLVIALCLAATAGIAATATGSYGLAGLLLTVIGDLPLAVAIFIAAGGWGWLAIRRLVPPSTTPGLLAVTSVGAGLWMLSTAMLTAGSLIDGAMTHTVGWAVIAGGLAMAAWACRKRVARYALPKTTRPGALIGIIVAAAGGLWLAGASMPAGKIGLVTKDFYDVVSYHLQIPREFVDAGRITPLPHNTYSHYPLGGEMLFALAMILKGGAWDGVYAAKFTHGLWGVLALAAVYFGLPPEQRVRRRTAAALLATAPMVLYLSWLAFVELSELAYLAIAIAWLAAWLPTPTYRAAIMIGLACGGACATKYLSIPLVAGPVLGVMLVSMIRRPRRITHWLAAAAVCCALTAPWLIRNALETGNPVFPLAANLLGAGHWSAEQVARWNLGHAPPAWSARLPAMMEPFTATRGVGIALTVMTLAAVAWVVAKPRRSPPLDRACVGILGLQVAAWMLLTHMPSRFIIPAVVPMCLLVGGMIARLVRWTEPSDSAGGLRLKWWTAPAATAMIVLAAAAGVLAGWELYRAEQQAAGATHGASGLHGMLPHDLASLKGSQPVFAPLASGGRLLLVGDIRPFNLPANTLYASIWELDPLTRIAQQTGDGDGVEMIHRLRRDYGVTHLLINWPEILRLHHTYGWWPQINPTLIDSLLDAGAVDLNIPTARDPKGRPAVQMLQLP